MKIFEWNSSTDEDCKVLFNHCRWLIDEQYIDDWNKFFELTLPNRNYGIGYEKNFQRGDISKKNAAKIVRSLERIFPNMASKLNKKLLREPDDAPTEVPDFLRRHPANSPHQYRALNPSYEWNPKHTVLSTTEPKKNQWETLLKHHGVYGRVDVALMFPTSTPEQKDRQEPSETKNNNKKNVRFAATGLAGRVAKPDHDPLSKIHIPLGEEFYFKFDRPHEGKVFALQNASGDWDAIPIEGERTITTLSSESQLVLPASDSGDPLPLTEEQETGRHKFVFVISEDPILETFAKEFELNVEIDPFLPDWLATEIFHSPYNYTVLQLDVKFVM